MGDNTPQAKSASWSKLALQAIKPAFRLLARPQTLAQLPRLFKEGMGPVRRLFIQAHNQRELSRLIHSGARLNFISSFARSGNTWTRNLLADALLQAQGIETNTDLPVPFQEVVPDYYCDLISRHSQAITMPGILVKTHDSFEQLQARILKQPGSERAESKRPAETFRNCKFVYLFRSPEDVLVSYFHLQRKVNYIERSQFGIDEFCRSQLPHWVENVDSYLRAADEGVAVYFVSYEGMLHDPAGALSGVLRWLEISHDAKIVERAVAHMNFANLRAREERDRPGAIEFALRRGGSGAALEELQPQTRCEIRETTAQVLKQANKRLARQTSLNNTAPGVRPSSASGSVSSGKADRFQPAAGLQAI
jgi:hypothetical protein